MLQHNGRRGSKGVNISYSPPPLAPPALQLTSWQHWGLWLVMAYCLDPITAWPPLCPQRTPINKSNPVFLAGSLAEQPSNTGITGRPRQRGGGGTVRAKTPKSVAWHAGNQPVPSANGARILFILKAAEKSPILWQKKKKKVVISKCALCQSKGCIFFALTSWYAFK